MTFDVHATRCSDYAPERLYKELKEHLDRYEGFKDLKRKKVLLKVNLLSASAPERAITTNPTFVEVLIGVIKERGGKVLIADSPGGLFNRTLLERAYEASGLKEVAERTGAELNYDTGSHEETVLSARFVKRFNICDFTRNADIIIALPKLKTHMFCGLTCASKIMFGIVPGTEKVRYHARFPDPNDFCKMLLDLSDLSRVDLFMVDAITGMDQEGPSKGRLRDIGVIISGKDPVLVDRFACEMVGLDPKEIGITKAAIATGRIGEVASVNASGSAARFKLDPPFDFEPAGSITRRPPRTAKRLVMNITTKKPRIYRRSCTGCGVCRDNCAGDAIAIVDDKAVIDYSKCIRCYCCHELCPYDAVYLPKGVSGARKRIENVMFKVFD